MDKQLKVAIGTEAFYPTIDGISVVAKCYADIINNKLGTGIVVTPNNPNQQDYKFPYQIYRYKSLFTFGEGYPVGWPFKREYSDAIIDMNFDILHSHCPIATSYYFRRVNRIKRIPQVLTYHTKYEYDIEARVPAILKLRAKNFFKNNINSADEVWVTSKGTVDSLRKFGYKGDYVVMPNGCDLPKVHITDEQIAMIRRKHNIDSETPILLYVGRMMWYKNIKLILEACRILKNQDIKFKMIMIGIGPEEAAIKKYCRKLRLNDDIDFTGQLFDRSELQIYYGAADLLIFPSTFDTNGLVVREAAASATASLLVRDSSASEGIVDTETGFLCDENSRSLAETIKKILPNKDLIQRVGIKAQSDIYISWEDAVKNAYDRYHVVIDKFNSTKHEPYKY